MRELKNQDSQCRDRSFARDARALWPLRSDRTAVFCFLGTIGIASRRFLLALRDVPINVVRRYLGSRAGKRDRVFRLKVAIKPEWKIADDVPRGAYREAKSRFAFPLMILPDLFG